MTTESKKLLSLGFVALGMCSLQLAGLTFAFPTRNAAAESQDDHAEVGNAEKKVVLISDQGFDPPVMKLKTLDGSVFFVNNTKDSLVTLNIDFGGKRAHCASGNLELSPQHQLVSKSPIAPKDFAFLCFPEKGKYAARAYGVKGKKDAVVGAVEVE